MRRENRKKDKVKLPEVLYTTSKLNTLTLGEKEGDRLINVSNKSETELGRFLSPLHTSNTRLYCGKVAKLKTFMEAIRTPNFPPEYLAKNYISKEDMNALPKERVDVPNYWAIVAYAVVERVKQDKKLITMLKENTLELTALDRPKPVIILGKEYMDKTISSVCLKLVPYVSILRHIELMIKEEKFFNRHTTDQFILSCRSNPDKDVFENCQIPLTEVKK